MASKSAPPKPMKNFTAVGSTRKKEKARPMKKSTTEAGTISPSTMRSRTVRAGKKNRQTWKKTTGSASRKPTNTDTLR